MINIGGIASWVHQGSFTILRTLDTVPIGNINLVPPVW